MRGKLILGIVALGLLWGGGQGIYTAVTNPTIHEYAIEDYLKSKPADKWIRIKGGIINMLEMNYASKKGDSVIKELYVPVVVAGTNGGQPVQVLLNTKDPKLIGIAEKVRDFKSEEDVMRFASDHHDDLFIHKDVDGLIKFGIDLKGEDVSKLKEINRNLAPDFVILKDGSKPALVPSLVLFVGGLGLSGWVIWGLFRRKPQAAAAASSSRLS